MPQGRAARSPRMLGVPVIPGPPASAARTRGILGRNRVRGLLAAGAGLGIFAWVGIVAAARCF